MNNQLEQKIKNSNNISVHKSKFTQKDLIKLSKNYTIKKEPFGYLKFSLKNNKNTFDAT